MRLISQLPTRERLTATEKRLNALKQTLTEEIEDAFSSEVVRISRQAKLKSPGRCK